MLSILLSCSMLSSSTSVSSSSIIPSHNLVSDNRGAGHNFIGTRYFRRKLVNNNSKFRIRSAVKISSAASLDIIDSLIKIRGGSVEEVTKSEVEAPILDAGSSNNDRCSVLVSTSIGSVFLGR